MSKTPRTLLENYLDVSKTQTVKVHRSNHGSLIRTPPTNQRFMRPRLSKTPEPYIHSSVDDEQHAALEKYTSRTPEPYIHSASKSRPQHDRVSMLRSRRRSVTSNTDVEETPRQMLQGFLESEDTTAPLVRYASRTSQGRLSTSQPILASSSSRSSHVRPGNVTVDLDYDTPRTLLQRYVLNTTDVIETPGPRNVISQQQSPDVTKQQGTYHTPSPFRTNSTESDSIPSPRFVRGRTPRSARRMREQFSIMENVNETVDESIIPPTNPADYQVPSAFCSSDDESVILETQPSTHVYKRSVHRKGDFNIHIPKGKREDVSLYNFSQIQSDDGMEESRLTGSHGENDDRVDNSVYETDFESGDGTRHMLLPEKPGTDMLPDFEEYTMPLKGGEMDRSPVISVKGYHRNSSFDSNRSRGNLSIEDIFDQQQGERDRDFRRMGRWSEGHQSRLQSSGHKSTGRDRRSMPGQMTIDSYLSPRQEMRRQEVSQSEMQNSRIENSSTESSRYDRQRGRSFSSRSPDMISRMSSRRTDRIVDAVSPARMKSFNDLDEIYTAQKLEYSTRDKLHQSLPNFSGNFSPRVYSTQRNMDMDTYEDDEDRPPSNITASPIVSPSSSPRSETPSTSTRISRVLMPSNRDNQTMSNSPVGSARSLSSRNSSRQSSLREHTPQVSTPMSGGSRYGTQALMSSRRGNQSASVSPSGSARSLSSRNSSRQSALRDFTPRQILTPTSGRSRYQTPTGTGKRSTSRDHSPLQNVTPSPVVSSGAASMTESRSSVELQPSTRKSRTHLDDSAQGSLREEKQRLDRSSSSLNRSLNRSLGQTPSKQLSASVVAGRRLAPDMVTTLPNNTVNFSPQIASTQNLAAMSHTGPGVVNRSLKGDTYDGVDEDVDHVDGEENDEGHSDNDEQWQDQRDEEPEVIESQKSQHSSVPMDVEPTPEPKQKKVVRKPRQKSSYSLPVNVVKKQFSHFAGMRVSKEAVEEVMKASEKYWDIMARDLEAYAKHAGRKQINMSDFILLFKRQGHVTEKQSLKSLIEKYLPMEEREKLIPVARAGNRIDPKL